MSSPYATLAMLTCVAVAACGDAEAQPVDFRAPVAVIHDADADVYLVSCAGGSWQSPDGSSQSSDEFGFIARVEAATIPGAKPKGSKWIASSRDGVRLRQPGGLALHGDVLWVTDGDVVRRFDRVSGEPRGEIAVPRAAQLHDCAASEDGALWISGELQLEGPSTAGAIWRLELGGPTPAVVAQGPELGQPTALVARSAAVYAVGSESGEFYELDASGRRTVIGRAPTVQLTGLARFDGAYFAMSAEGACVYRFDVMGSVVALPGRLDSPGNGAVDAARRRLVVPRRAGNTLAVVELGPR